MAAWIAGALIAMTAIVTMIIATVGLRGRTGRSLLLMAPAAVIVGWVSYRAGERRTKEIQNDERRAGPTRDGISVGSGVECSRRREFRGAFCGRC